MERVKGLEPSTSSLGSSHSSQLSYTRPQKRLKKKRPKTDIKLSQTENAIKRSPKLTGWANLRRTIPWQTLRARLRRLSAHSMLQDLRRPAAVSIYGNPLAT